MGTFKNQINFIVMKSFFATAVIAAIVFAAEDEAVPKDEPDEKKE